MPLILDVERTSRKSIILYVFLYLFLTLGALTMVYPFLLMISGSFSSKVDTNEFSLMPSFILNEESLHQKYIESKYNENLQNYVCTTHADVLNFSAVKPPSNFAPALLDDWKSFHANETLPTGWYLTAFGPTQDGKIIQENERAFRKYMQEVCGNNLTEFRDRFGESIENWFFLKFQPERLLDRKYQLSARPFSEAFYAFKNTLPPQDRIYLSCEGAYLRFARLTSQPPQELDLSGSIESSASWEEFVRTALHPQFIFVDETAKSEWIAFLSKKYASDITQLNKLYGSTYASFDSVLFPTDKLRSSPQLKDYMLFIGDATVLQRKHLYLDTPELRWRRFLKKKYDNLSAVNEAHQRDYGSFEQIYMPQSEADWHHVKEHKSALIRQYILRNYQMVFEYIVLYGRGLFNTVVYCALSILLALLVNPLAAYALSRYNLSSQYKILLFLIATMAFPAVVTMIPNFLLLRDLGLLNTFAALLLPGMANGYSIFLLKGFFDSLPKELYEAAELDGATEWNKFWMITMNLSKPILAVIALGAFNAAYANFMYAFILCQDRDMWTLMVWLYQLQQFSSQGVVFASLIIAAIPTLIVFVCFQNVILRGIVVPTEK